MPRNKGLVRQGLLAVLIALVAGAPAAHAAGDPLRERQWSLDLVAADRAHEVTRGEGAVVAVVDTGVDSAHEDLQGRLLPGRDFVDGDASPQDGDGHGTHVTGTVAAAAGNGVGVGSVAPGARVLPVRVLADDGSGDDAAVARGIDYAVAQRVDVINLSLGGLPLDGVTGGGPFAEAVQRAVDAGIVVVAAAGNDAVPLCEQPSVRGKILCVGAVDRRGMRSFYSSGDSATLMAPGGSGAPAEGEDILSTVPGPARYEEFAGTSQAAPHAAGVAALLASRGVHGRAAVDRILATARDAGPAGPDPVYGAGILDASAAVAGLSPTPAGAPVRAAVSMRRSHRMSRTRRQGGVRARCRSPRAGTCRVLVRRGRTVLARGAARVKAGGSRTFKARLTRAGKRRMRGRRSFRAVASLKAPGERSRRIKIIFRR